MRKLLLLLLLTISTSYAGSADSLLAELNSALQETEIGFNQARIVDGSTLVISARHEMIEAYLQKILDSEGGQGAIAKGMTKKEVIQTSVTQLSTVLLSSGLPFIEYGVDKVAVTLGKYNKEEAAIDLNKESIFWSNIARATASKALTGFVHITDAEKIYFTENNEYTSQLDALGLALTEDTFQYKVEVSRDKNSFKVIAVVAKPFYGVKAGETIWLDNEWKKGCTPEDSKLKAYLAGWFR